MLRYEVKVAYPDSDRVDRVYIVAESEQQACEKAVGNSRLEVISVEPVNDSIDRFVHADVPSYAGLRVVGILMLVLCVVLAAVAMVMFVLGLGRSRHEMGAWMTAAMGMGFNCLWLAAVGFALLAFRDLVLQVHAIRGRIIKKDDNAPNSEGAHA